MTFQFRMEQVLEYKHNEKEIVQKEYAGHQEQFEEIGTALYELLKKKESIQQQQSERIVSGDQIRAIQQFGVYIDQMDRQADSLQRRLQIARENMENAKNRLIEKTIDVKKYEKLKEKQRGRYIKEAELQEARQMDELVVIRHSNQENR